MLVLGTDCRSDHWSESTCRCRKFSKYTPALREIVLSDTVISIEFCEIHGIKRVRNRVPSDFAAYPLSIQFYSSNIGSKTNKFNVQVLTFLRCLELGYLFPKVDSYLIMLDAILLLSLT